MHAIIRPQGAVLLLIAILHASDPLNLELFLFKSDARWRESADKGSECSRDR